MIWSQEWMQRLSKKVGIDLSYLLKNGTWVTLRFFIMSASGLLLSLCFARLGTKELLGQYQYIIALFSTLSIVSLPGLNAAALESVVKGHEGAVIRVVKISFLASLFGSLFLIVFGLFRALYSHNWTLGVTLISAAILFAPYAAMNTWNVYYDGRSEFRQSALRYIALNVGLNLALMLGIFLGANSFQLVLIFLLVNILFLVVFFRGVINKIQDRNDDEVDISFGISVSVQRFVFGLSSTLPTVAIAHIFGDEPVAVYYIATYFSSAVFAFLGNIFYLYLPALFRGKILNHGNILIQNVVVGIFCWVTFLIFLKFIFQPLYGFEYESSRMLAYSISPILIFVSLKTYLINFFMTRKRNWFLAFIIAVAHAVSLSILYLTRGLGFSQGTILYLYSVELLILIPIIFAYTRFIYHEKYRSV